MSSGFNSDVSVAGDVCHVQTEEHGPPECLIETLVYHRGRILHRRSSNYSDLASAAGYSETVVRERVENQHRAVIDAIRDGAIPIPDASESSAGSNAADIQVWLRNADSWRAGGTATLDVQVVHRNGGHGAANANVEAYFTSAKQEARFAATTGDNGLAQLRFAMPPLGPDGCELVIRAFTESGSDEVRYALRSKPKSAPPEAKS